MAFIENPCINLMQESIIAASAHKINPFFCFFAKKFRL